MELIDGEPIEIEWNIFPGFTSIEKLWHIQKNLNARQIHPDQFEGRMMCMSMFNDIDWTKKGHADVCLSNAREVSDYAKVFQRGHWPFLGPGDEEQWYGTCKTSQKGNGTSTPIKWLNYSHRVVIPYSEAQVRSAEEHWIESKDETLFSSQRTQKTLSW